MTSCIGQTKRIQRSIMGCLQPLMGTRSSGTALVKSTSGHVELPAGSFAAPMPASATGAQQIRRGHLIRTTEYALCDTTGVLVAIESHLGGAAQNLVTATELRWDPAITNLEAVSVVSGGALSGGAASALDATCNQIVAYESLGTLSAARDLFQGKVQLELPALVVSWEGASPTDQAGQNRTRVTNNWSIFVVCARREGTLERGHEGLDLCDAITEILGDRNAVDGWCFSDPPATVAGVQRVGSTEHSYIYAVQLHTHNAVLQRDWRDEAGDFAVWKSTSISAQTDDTVPKSIIEDAEYAMAAGAFDSSFGQAFDGRVN